MTDFRQIFLAESINNLTTLQTRLAEDYTDDLRRGAFRAVHTVKGGAQTFGLLGTAELAHKLEDFLSPGIVSLSDKTLLLEGIALLIDSLRQSETDLPEDFIEKLRSASRTNAKSDVLLTAIPGKIFRIFSRQERDTVVSALREGKNIFCVEAGFQAASFAADYQNLQAALSQKGEIIASLPGENLKAEGKINFRIFLASRKTKENLQNSIEDFDAEISSYNCAEKPADNLSKLLSQVATHTEEIAERSGKKVRTTIVANDAALSAERKKAVFDILLQLVRNAVDHAVEQSGVIEVRFFDDGENFYLSVADDGRGIDLTKVRKRAVEKNLISDDDTLDELRTLNLIFASELSTADALTETSGRGVGLDAVKDLVEKMNGKISVRNRKTNGAIFEIFVPHEKI